MNVMEFQNYAKDSAKTYYKYLEENRKGLSEISVRTIRHAEPYFHLTLSKRLPAFAVGESLKSMKFRILGKLYSGSDMNPYEYDSQSAILTLDPQKERLRNLLLSVSVEDIFVISDLKFLVKRVFDWYTSHGEKIQLPLSGAFRANMAFSYYGALPTDEQKRAIHGALTSPFSYVWGAPGTGKTQCVLANCVLNVLLHKPDSQVLLIAPTNNAVEQMLFGILPILEGAGIPSSAVLRLGIASPKFAEKYKDSCETYYLQQKINSITTERGHLLKYIAFLEFESKLSAFRERLPGFLSDLNDARQKHSNLVGTLSSLESKEISLKTTWLLLENDIAQLQKSIHAKRIEIASFRGKLKKLFLPSSYETMQRHLDTCYDMLRFKDKSIADTQNKLSDLYSSIAECKDSFEIVEYTVSNIKSHMMDVSPAYAPLKHAIKTFSITSFAESADNLFRSIEAAGLLLDERRSRYAAYENVFSRSQNSWISCRKNPKVSATVRNVLLPPPSIVLFPCFPCLLNPISPLSIFLWMRRLTAHLLKERLCFLYMFLLLFWVTICSFHPSVKWRIASSSMKIIGRFSCGHSRQFTSTAFFINRFTMSATTTFPATLRTIQTW